MVEKIVACGNDGKSPIRPPVFVPESIAQQIKNMPIAHPDGTPFTEEEMLEIIAQETGMNDPDLLGS